MTQNRKAAAALVGAVAFGLAWARGCSGPEESPRASGGSAGVGAADTGPTGASSSGGAAAGGGSGGGTGGKADSSCGSIDSPQGWEPYTVYSCACRLWVPGKGTTVEPVAWEGCPAPGPANPTCKRMATPWKSTPGAVAASLFVPYWYDATAKKSYFQFGRLSYGDDKDVRQRVVVDLDGPVVNAFLQLNPYNEGCALNAQSVNEGKYAFAVVGDGWSGKIGGKEGVLAGEIGSPPKVVLKNDLNPTLYTEWRVSSKWLVRWKSTVTARAWESGDEHLVYDAALDPEGAPATNVDARKDAVFLQVGAGAYRGVMSWTLAEGVRPLVRWYGDLTQAAGNFNTDGVDMVWTHVQDKSDASEFGFSKRSVWTAPFTMDPAVVKAKGKRLRSDPGQLTVEPFGIGCGFAGRIFPQPAPDGGIGTTDVLVVRLSDGVSWIIPGAPLETDVDFIRVLGFSCEEVFLLMQYPPEPINVVRIRLDSLGAGSPPD